MTTAPCFAARRMNTLPGCRRCSRSSKRPCTPSVTRCSRWRATPGTASCTRWHITALTRRRPGKSSSADATWIATSVATGYGASCTARWHSTGAACRKSIPPPIANLPPAPPPGARMSRIRRILHCRGSGAMSSGADVAGHSGRQLTMKFWLSLVAVHETEQLPQLARYAEELGFHGLMVGDHLIWPAHIATRYPYSPDGKIFVPPDTPWPDPWVLFAHLGALCPRLHFASNIYLAALRDPFTVAKSVATAAVLTQGRIVCGVSAGWLKEEYEIAGVDFASRGARLDEALTVVRKLWSGQPVQHAGERF